jgi:hypothetical protein
MRDTDGMLPEDILNSITVGQMVYDAEGAKVGTIDAVDRVSHCMRIETNPFSEPALCIPIELIRSIDVRELFVSLTLEDLRRNYVAGDRRRDDR